MSSPSMDYSRACLLGDWSSGKRRARVRSLDCGTSEREGGMRSLWILSVEEKGRERSCEDGSAKEEDWSVTVGGA